MTHHKDCTVCGNPAALLLELPEATVYACQRCGHEHTDDSRINTDIIYTPDYFLKIHKKWFENPDTELFQITTKILLGHASKTQRILDVGCGNGNFLRHLLAEGFENLHGVDIAPTELPAPITFHNERLEDYCTDQPFDAIISMANIEHISNITSAVQQMRSLLRDGGLMIIYTVRNESLLYSLSKMLYSIGVKFCAERFYAPHHVNHFSKKSLTYLAEHNGFIPMGVTRKNIPIKSVDLGESAISPLLFCAIATINTTAIALRQQMLQLAVFKKK